MASCPRFISGISTLSYSCSTSPEIGREGVQVAQVGLGHRLPAAAGPGGTPAWIGP